MIERLAQNWWVILVRGLISLSFGLLALFFPGITLAALIRLFGIFVTADGIFISAAAIARRDHPTDWLLLLQGLFCILMGVLSFTNPGITAIVLVWYIGIWIIIVGIFEIVVAIRLARQIKGEGWYILGGLLSIIIGLILIINPLPGAVALTWLFGSFSIVFGIFRLISAFRVRKWNKTLS